MRRLLCISAMLLPVFLGAQNNLFRSATAVASSAQEGAPVSYVNDGNYARSSTWMSGLQSKAPHIVELTLPFYAKLDSIVIYNGIEKSEMLPEETTQAGGYWCLNNFILQYWDDANWTDIPGTNTTENRLERVSFHFKEPVTSFRFRLYATDGEVVRVREIEGYGTEDKSIKVPDVAPAVVSTGEWDGKSLEAVIYPEHDGTSMRYVGYNQGYFVPGNNARIWWEYSGVNAARIWADLKTYVQEDWMHDFGKIESLEDFERAKRTFLSDTEKYVPFGQMAEKADETVLSTNTMSLNYALSILKELDIDVVLQSSISRSWYKAGWDDRWALWQRFFCQVYYCAKTGGVTMFALCNEPNHRNAGPMPLDKWIALSKIASDAMQCAFDVLNREQGTSMTCRFVGPVTAGTNTNWWSEVAESQRTDYKGEPADRDIVGVFSTHSYNLPAIGYDGRMEMMDKLISDHHPLHKTVPVVFTETGRWMNAYLIDKEETMDSPSLFTEWAGMYTANMMGGCYGMWAFKFANTASSTYPQGIKSGHHHTWKGLRWAEDSYDNLALHAKACSSIGDASAVIDGNKSTAWMQEGSGEKWVRLDFPEKTAIGGLVIYTGSEGGEFTAPDRIRDMKIEYLGEKGWTVFKEGDLKANKYARNYLTAEPAVLASSVRVTAGETGLAKIREIKVFGPDTISSASESYDISGVQRTAEVVRLFAKGFKDARPLLKSEVSEHGRSFDFAASEDPENGARYIWLVQRNECDCNCRIDLSRLGVRPGALAVCETVSGTSFGEASISEVSAGGTLELTVPAKSVMLVTLARDGRQKTFKPAVCEAVHMTGTSDVPEVEMNQHDRDHNSVTYFSFDVPARRIGSAGRILLAVKGTTGKESPFRFHVYGFDRRIRKHSEWEDAPHLSSNESLAVAGSDDFFVAGEMTMTSRKGYHYLDVTEAVKKHCGKSVTFMLIRELREPGDDYDNGFKASLDRDAKLILW